MVRHELLRLKPMSHATSQQRKKLAGKLQAALMSISGAIFYLLCITLRFIKIKNFNHHISPELFYMIQTSTEVDPKSNHEYQLKDMG